MAALCAYSTLFYVVLCLWVGGQNTEAGVSDSDFSPFPHSLKALKLLEVLDKVSPKSIIERMQTIEARASNSDGGNRTCSGALDKFVAAIEQGDIWALQMADASSKLPVGLLDGNLVDLGAYDECVDVDVVGDPPLDGQHCLVVAHLHFNSTPAFAPPGVLAVLGDSLAYTFALCLPSSCSPQTLAVALVEVAEDVNLLTSSANLTVTFAVDPSDCHVKDRPPLDTGEVVGIVVTLCCLILVAISTTIDMALLYQNEYSENQAEVVGCLRVATAFSLYSNGRRLLDTRVPEDSLAVLHSLKFLGIAWVALGHRIRFSVQAPLTNLLGVADYVKDWSSMLVLNATLSVDVFFLISGILNTYGYMNVARRRGRSLVSHIVGYVHRYLRLTPAYVLMILVTATWLYRLGDGPLWDRLVGDARQDCTQYWWSNLLYVNNYYNPNNNCMMQSWYLAADMQLFWLSPLVLYPLWRWPMIGIVNLFVLIIISIIIPFVVAFSDEIKTPIPISFDQERVNREMAELYFPTHTKAVSYFIGILTGYSLHLLRTNKVSFKIHWLTNSVVWSIAVAFLAYGVFGGYYIFQLDRPYNPWQSSLYIGVYRFFWSVGLAWVILACSVGYGGFVNSWLSVKVFAPLGRLTYCIYLTHVAVILYSVGSLRQPQHFTYYEMILKFLGEFVIATFLAMVLTLTIEAPIMVLEKVILSDSRSRVDRVVNVRRSSRSNSSELLHQP